MYYLSSVYPPIPRSESIDDDGPPLTPVVSGVPATRPPAHLILAGYSYGALLTRYLPRIPALLGRFSKVLKTSTKAEIRLRAAKLASVTHIDILSRPLHGTEASGNARRSRGVQSSRPGDRTDRTSEDWALEKDSHMQYLQTPFVRDGKRDSWPDQHNGLDPDDDDYIARLDVPTPKTHYLLISLLLGPVAALCTGFGALGNAELDSKFMYNETLVLHGEKDRLTSLKRLSSWADALMPGRDRRFAVVKIENTGHFWRDKRAIEDLERTIKTWVRTYVKDESQSS